MAIRCRLQGLTRRQRRHGLGTADAIDLVNPGEAGRRAIISGSGPTVAVLCDDADAARFAAEHLTEQFDGYEVFVAEGPDRGAQVERVI